MNQPDPENAYTIQLEPDQRVHIFTQDNVVWLRCGTGHSEGARPMLMLLAESESTLKMGCNVLITGKDGSCASYLPAS